MLNGLCLGQSDQGVAAIGIGTCGRFTPKGAPLNWSKTAYRTARSEPAPKTIAR